MNRCIAWAGNPYFVTHLRRAGNRVVVLPQDRVPLSWSDVLRACDGEPDLFVYGDCSTVPFLKGIESFPCLTLFYAVDTHIHSWYPHYAQAFDLCCVAMRDHMAAMRGQRLTDRQLRWLPLFAKDRDRPMEIEGELDFDVLFVGKNDPVLTPGRHRLLQTLAERVPLAVRQGYYPELYARAKLVLNVSEHGDLNFRVFEALGCGSCLVTPRVGHGLLDLFRDGEDLFCYDPHDMEGLVTLIQGLLLDADKRMKAADSGMRVVDSFHRAEHRCRDLLEWVAAVDSDHLIRARLAQAGHIHRVFLRLLYLLFAESESNAARRRMYLEFAEPGYPA